MSCYSLLGSNPLSCLPPPQSPRPPRPLQCSSSRKENAGPTSSYMNYQRRSSSSSQTTPKSGSVVAPSPNFLAGQTLSSSIVPSLTSSTVSHVPQHPPSPTFTPSRPLAEDQRAFHVVFDESLRTRTEMNSYVRLKARSPVTAQNIPQSEVLFEVKGYPHFIKNELAARCFFAVAKPYPSRNVAM